MGIEIAARSTLLAQLLREVIDQIPLDIAQRLGKAYVEGKTVIVYLGQNSHDAAGNKTAFAVEVTSNQDWRSRADKVVVDFG